MDVYTVYLYLYISLIDVSAFQAFHRQCCGTAVVFCQVYILWIVRSADTLRLSLPNPWQLPYQEIQLYQLVLIQGVSLSSFFTLHHKL